MKTVLRKSRSFLREHIRPIAAVCVIILAVIMIQMVHMRYRESAFLRSARLESSAPLLQRTGYRYWHDILQYTDGYEVMTFQPDRGTVWSSPAEWIKEHIPLWELTDRFGISIHPDTEKKLNPDSTVCDAWYVQVFTGQSVPFHQRQYWLCFHDAAENLVTVYRGHHLCGLSSPEDAFSPYLELIRKGQEEELAACCEDPDLAGSILQPRKQYGENHTAVHYDYQIQSLKITNGSAEIRFDVTLSGNGPSLYYSDNRICFERMHGRWMITEYREHPQASDKKNHL